MEEQLNIDNDIYLWILSAFIDYTCLGLGLYEIEIFQGGGREHLHWTLSFMKLLLQGLVGTLIYIGREHLHFILLGSRTSPYKYRRYNSRNNKQQQKQANPHSIKNIIHVLFNTEFGFFLMLQCDLIYHDEPELSFTYWLRNFAQFYAMLILRDVFFLYPFHTLMHSSKKQHKWLRKIHQRHHEVQRDAQSLHAYHIDTIDLFIENGGAPLLLFICQYLVGFKPGMSWQAITLFLAHDVALHSINPYSVSYFNPILDLMFYPNICHQLHHATNKDYMLFTPYHHILPSNRRKDGKNYNEKFLTKFSFLHE